MAEIVTRDAQHAPMATQRSVNLTNPIHQHSEEDITAARDLLAHQNQGRQRNGGDAIDPGRSASTLQDTTIENEDDHQNGTHGTSPSNPTNHIRSSSMTDGSSDAQHNARGSISPTLGQTCSNCGTTKTPLWRRSPTGATICNACGLYQKARNNPRPANLKRPAASMAPHSQNQDRSISPISQPDSVTHHGAGPIYVTADQVPSGTCPGGGRCNGTGGANDCGGCPAYNNRMAKATQLSIPLAQSQMGSEEVSQPDRKMSPPGEIHPEDAHENEQLQMSQPTDPNTTNVVVACQNCRTTVTPLWRRDESGHTICNACGLYHKLHGKHRPVAMKKSVIKRRKRVVPAPLDQQANGHPPLAMAQSASPEPLTSQNINSGNSTSSVELDNIATAPMQPQKQSRDPYSSQMRNPIPIDFTGTPNFLPDPRQPQSSHSYSISTSFVRAASEQRNLSISPHPPTSLAGTKRGLSAMDSDVHDSNDPTRANRLSSISSILNPTQQTSSHDLMPLDPTLAAMGKQQSRQQQSGVKERGNRDQRKKVLTQETETLREKLRELERELKDLDEQG
ncbi:MAG: putative electron transfer flavoprotein subunit [Cirrosporium novae-zelandiae]|nr:MAG: putative electron transfer flavoprotein subunit [Cirrosporium novae-zelandiae]